MAAEDDGASPRELVLEAARRNNTSLLDDVFSTIRKAAGSEDEAEQQIADLINNSRDATGFTALHLGAKYGNYEVLDALLDQPRVETDPLTPSARQSPLHVVVGFSNDSTDNWPAAAAIADMLTDAGCDPRLRDASKRKPVELLAEARGGGGGGGGGNEELKTLLRKAEVLITEGAGLVDEDDEDDDEDAGPPSDNEI